MVPSPRAPPGGLIANRVPPAGRRELVQLSLSWFLYKARVQLVRGIAEIIKQSCRLLTGSLNLLPEASKHLRHAEHPGIISSKLAPGSLCRSHSRILQHFDFYAGLFLARTGIE